MKAWGLLLSTMVACAGCATAPVALPVDGYDGPALRDIENFDRAGIDVIRGPQLGRQASRILEVGDRRLPQSTVTASGEAT